MRIGDPTQNSDIHRNMLITLNPIEGLINLLAEFANQRSYAKFRYTSQHALRIGDPTQNSDIHRNMLPNRRYRCKLHTELLQIEV